MMINLLLAALFAAPGHAGAAVAARGVQASTAAVSASLGRLSVRCARKPLALDSLLTDASFRADMATFGGDEVRGLLEYASCRELQGAAGRCARLDGLGVNSKGNSTECRVMAAEARFVFATLRGGDALAACRALVELDGKSGPAVDKDCNALIKVVRAEGANLSCGSLKGAGLTDAQTPCEDFRAFWSGDERACERQKNPRERRACLARAGLAAGLRSPGRCASSPACRALVEKSPAACDVLRTRGSDALCARVAQDLADEKSRLEREKDRAVAAKAPAKMAADAAAAAKLEAAAAKAKAAAAALQEKLAKQAAANAAKQAAIEAANKAKAEAAAKKDAATKAKIARERKPQFSKGEPMEKDPLDPREALKALEEGRPLPVKPKPKPESE